MFSGRGRYVISGGCHVQRTFVDSRQKEFPSLYLCGSAIDVQLDRRIAVAMTGLL